MKATADKVTKSPIIKAILSACAPDYTGRKIRVVTKLWHSEQHEGGGTNYDVTRFDFATGRATKLATPRAFSGPTTMDYEIGAGCALVVTGSYCGKDAGVTIIVRPFTDTHALAIALDARLQGSANAKILAWTILHDAIDPAIIATDDAGCGCGGEMCRKAIVRFKADLWASVIDARFVAAKAAELRAPVEA